MSPSLVTAVGATLIAVISLIVSISEARSNRLHNRHSVRPHLDLTAVRDLGDRTGIKVSNYGLGPAIIRESLLTVDGVPLGPWDEETLNRLRDQLPSRPATKAFRAGEALPAGYEGFLIHLPDYENGKDAWFWDLLRLRLQVSITYESLYGERFTVASEIATRTVPPAGQVQYNA